MVLKQKDDWTTETLQKDNNRFEYVNKGNFFVEMKVNGESMLTFQLPRLDIDRRQFFALFAGIYDKVFQIGAEAGRREFAEQLRYMVNYSGGGE